MLSIVSPKNFTDGINSAASATITSNAAVSFRRPPSLFAKVYASQWNAMTEAEKTEFVDGVARIAESAGYVGLQLRNDDEVAVAQWLKKTGVRILDTPTAARRR